MNSSEAGPRRRLLLAREAAKLTQAEVAAHLTEQGHKTSRQAVGRVETGKGEFTMEQLALLFPLYGVTPSFIFFGRDLAVEVKHALSIAAGVRQPAR